MADVPEPGGYDTASKWSLLGASIGRAVVSMQGLQGVYLPFGLEPLVADSVVWRTNQMLGPGGDATGHGHEPVALRYWDADAQGQQPHSALGVEYWDRDSVIQRRLGRRLVVADTGSVGSLETLKSSFQLLMNEDYPAGTLEPVVGDGGVDLSLKGLAASIADELLYAFALDAGDITQATRRHLESATRYCISYLRDAYWANTQKINEGSGADLRRWNLGWFRHVDEALSMLASYVSASAELDLEDPRKLVFAAMALPRPDNGGKFEAEWAYRSANNARAFADLVRSGWNSEVDIGFSLARMNLVESEPSIGDLSWEGLDRRRAAGESSLWLFAGQSRDSSDYLDVFGSLTEKQFFGSEAPPKSLYFAAADGDGPGAKLTGRLYAKEVAAIELEVPLAGELAVPLWIGIGVLPGAGRQTVEWGRTGLEFRINAKQLSLDRDGPPVILGGGNDSGDVLWFRVVLRHSTAEAESKVSWPVKTQTVHIEMPDGDPLLQLVDPKTTGRLVVGPPDIPYLIVEQRRSGSRAKPADPRVLLPDQVFLRPGHLEAPDGAATVGVGPEADAETSVVCLGDELQGVGVARDGRRVLTVQDDGGEVRFRVRRGGFEVKSAESGKDADKEPSPLVAAAMDRSVSYGTAEDAEITSLRGSIERSYRRLLEDGDEALLHSLGHVVLPVSNHDAAVDDLEQMPDSPWLVPSATIETNNAVPRGDVPVDLVESESAREFRRAFAALGLGRLFDPDTADAQMGATTLISQIPFGEWLDGHRVEAYVDAYIGLIEAAKRLAVDDVEGHGLGLFWATYPFSISVWDADRTSQAVLLSPLHPLRLLWLHSAETVLRNADGPLKRGLAAVVEGWALPALGPTEEKDRMVAVAGDAGSKQIFLGWGLMARASVGGTKAIRLPEFAGNRRLPGSSTGGLNAEGVKKAIGDYRLAFPYATTLTVDLAAQSETSRLASIDKAVVEGALEKREKIEAGASLLGGLRVFDSCKRLGAPPDLAEHQGFDRGSAPAVPIVWRRYNPDSRDSGRRPPASDIRVLEDSGASVVVEGLEDGTDSNAGVLAAKGVRRLEVRGGIPEGREADGARPGLGKEDETLLGRALNAVETDEKGRPFRVKSNLEDASFSDSARWTVAGSTLHPGLVSRLLERSPAELTLWEWRPPFLEGGTSGAPRLDRRPYLALTRVSQVLKDQIDEKLARVDNYPADDANAQQLLRVLGQHGVGLSRMFVRKDKQITGAIGFALMFRLIEAAPPAGKGYWDFVFPIDVCEGYLKAMSASEKSTGQRRADLLLMRLHSEGQLDLAPIEIKVRNLEEPQGAFPPETNETLRDGAEQANQTVDLLESIVSNVEEAGEADRVLLSAALGALLDAAISLSPHLPTDYDALRGAVYLAVVGPDGAGPSSGQIRVRRPMVAYLTNGAHGDRGEPVQLRRSFTDQHPHCQLLVNIGDLATNLWVGGDANEFSNKWNEAVDWMVADASDGVEGRPLGAAGDVSGNAGSISAGSTPDATHAGGVQDAPYGTVVDAGPSTQDRPDGTSSTVESATPEGVEGDGVPAGPIVDGGIRFPVGYFLGTKGPISAEFWPANTELNQMNVGVVGTQGTGKTELVKALVWQIRRLAPERQVLPVSFLVLDYKGDYNDVEFLRAVGGTSTAGVPIPLDVLQLGESYTAQAAFRKASMFADVIKRIYGGVGPKQAANLRNSIVELFSEMDGVSPTLHEVYERYLRTAGGADAVSGVLEYFTQGGWFEQDRSKLKAFDELLGDGVLVVSLEHQDLDGQAKNAIVGLMLNLYRSHMLSQKRWPFEGTSPQLRRINSYLLVDEAQEIMQYGFEALGDVLLKGRQFGVGTILSSQFLSHFREGNIDYGETLLTWFIHKVSQLTKNELAQLGDTGVTQAVVDEIKQLGVSHSYYRSLGSDGRIIREVPYWQLVQDGDDG